MSSLGLTWLPQEGELGVLRTPLSPVLIKAALRCEELEGSQPPWGPGPARSVLCFPFHCVSNYACCSGCSFLAVCPLGRPPCVCSPYVPVPS